MRIPNRIILSVLVAVAVAALRPARAAEPSAEDWREDLNTLAEQLPRVHANAFHAISREEWLRRVAALDRDIPALTRNQICVRLMQLVAAIGDGHTSLSPFYLPELGFHAAALRFYAFSDGIFVRAADAAHRDLVGARLIRVGNLSVDEAFARVATAVSHDNEEGLKQVVPLAFGVGELLDGLGVNEGAGEISYGFEKDGKTFTARVPVTIPLGHAAHAGGSQWIDPPGWIDARNVAAGPVPAWLENPADFYWMNYRESTGTLYVQYNAVANKPDEPIAAFFDRVFRFAGQHRVERFVLDLRHNAGGDSYYNTPIVRGLLHSGLDARGRLFVLIGRSTFSAAQNLVNDLSKYARPTYVGEPTGSRPNQYGDHDPVALPRSGLVVMVSTFFHQDAGKHDRRSWTAPHISSPLSFSQYRRNEDPAMEIVERYRSVATALAGPIRSGDAAEIEQAYSAFKQGPETAWIDTEREINDLGYETMGQRNLAVAERLFRLNVSSYPQSVNAHDSLGEVYLAEGKLDLAREEYRRVLALSPGSENAERVLREIDARERSESGKKE